jgi:hypothetical protein
MAVYFEGGKRIDVTQDLSCSVLNGGSTDRNMLEFNKFMLNNRENCSPHNHIYYKNNICL